MHIHNIHDLLQDKRFRKIIWKKRQLSVFFALGVIVLFFGFILVIAFSPGLLSPTVDREGVINLYLLVSVALIILVCVLMNLFVALKLRDTHEDIHELIDEIREDR
jgi:uncharacterized membrane protein (DUF485 family)